MAIEIEVNGTRRSVDDDPETPLLWVLRDTLGLTGTKYGCGQGQCRTCTVHLDGRPVPSCQLQVGKVGSGRITTIEGLSPDRSHPVQRAWLAEQVPQCGYCQSGQILTACALLERTPAPDDAAIDAAMSPVLCRCGTYPRIRKAIHTASRLILGEGAAPGGSKP